MKIFWPVLFLVVVHFNCTGSTSEKGNVQKQAQAGKNQQTKPGSSYSDTIQINPPVAVFYSPDSMQLEKIKSILEKQIFETAVHECFYQMRNSRQILQKYYPAVKIIEVSKSRYLLFYNNGGGKELIDLDQENEFCGIYLFDGSQSPRHVEMMNIETELGVYFSPGYRRQP